MEFYYEVREQNKMNFMSHKHFKEYWCCYTLMILGLEVRLQIISKLFINNTFAIFEENTFYLENDLIMTFESSYFL